jgi:peptide deformylase
MLELKYYPYELLNKKVFEFKFDEITDPEKIEHDMITVMSNNGGIGLAANQVDLDARVFVLGSNGINGFPKPQAFFNPIITDFSQEQSIDKEGCLSFPSLWLNVKRPTWIEMSYQDSKGNWNDVRIDGYLAKAIQHEIDHLDGICFINRVSKLKIEMALKKLMKKRK